MQTLRGFVEASHNPDLTTTAHPSTGAPETRHLDHISFQEMPSQLEDWLSDFTTLDSLLYSGFTAVKRLRNHSSSVVPLHRLPNEMISEVFLATVSGTYKERNTDLRSISLVCNKWHDIARHTPELWKSISFDRTQGRDLDRLSRWIALSAHCGLDLAFPIFYLQHIPGRARTAMDSVFQAYPRWRSLAFSGNLRDSVARGSFTTGDSLGLRLRKCSPQERLKSIRIVDEEMSSFNEMERGGLSDILADKFPGLQELTLVGGVSFTTPNQLFPRLRTLRLYLRWSIPSRHLNWILQSCLLLEDLLIDSEVKVGVPDAFPPIAELRHDPRNLPCLRHLCLRNAPIEQLRKFFRVYVLRFLTRSQF
jgi:hypothetical protein